MRVDEFIQLNFKDASDLLRDWVGSKLKRVHSWTKNYLLPKTGDIYDLLTKPGRLEDAKLGENIWVIDKFEDNLEFSRMEIFLKYSDLVVVVYSVGNTSTGVTLKEIYVQGENVWSKEYPENNMTGFKLVSIGFGRVQVNMGRSWNPKSVYGQLIPDRLVELTCLARKVEEYLDRTDKRNFCCPEIWPFYGANISSTRSTGDFLAKLIRTSADYPLGDDEIRYALYCWMGAIRAAPATKISDLGLGDIAEPWPKDIVDWIKIATTELKRLIRLKSVVDQAVVLMRDAAEDTLQKYIEGQEFGLDEVRQSVMVRIKESIDLW